MSAEALAFAAQPDPANAAEPAQAPELALTVETDLLLQLEPEVEEACSTVALVFSTEADDFSASQAQAAPATVKASVVIKRMRSERAMIPP